MKPRRAERKAAKLARWEKRKAARNEAPPAPIVALATSAEPKRGLRVSSRAGMDARAILAEGKPQRSFADVFPVAPPPPSVPDGDQLRMAMDDALKPIYGFAANFNFGFFGDGEAWPGFPYLAELTQRPEYRMITETRAKEMTRKWIKLTYDGDEPNDEKLDALGQAIERFKIRDLFRKAAEHDGFFGGGQVFIDVGAPVPRLKEPLIISDTTIRKGGVKGFVTIEPMWSYPNAYNSTDPLKPDFFTPQTWFVNGTMVHRTRLLTMISAEMPDILKPAYSFRGLSMSQRAKPYVDNWLRTRQSVSDITHAFSIVVLKSLLQSQIASGAEWTSVYDRIDIFNATRDNRGTMVIDKESEEMDILNAPLGTLDALQAQAQEQMASVSQIPLVKLLGITPSGLNASSDGEIRVFYDNILAMQEHLFRDPLKRIIEVIQINEFGSVDRKIGFDFVSLWQMDEAAQALIRKTDADTDALYIEAGVLDPLEVRTKLANDDQSPYAGLDPEDLPEPPVDETDPETGGDPAKGAEPRAEERSGV